MGDRFVSKFRKAGDRLMASRLAHMRGKPPPEILAWGLGDVARIGHNNGPPLDDETPGYLWRRHRWTTVHAEVWKTPPLGVLKFRVARAEAAGLSYHDYMLTLLDTGRFAQARDRDVERTRVIERVRAAFGNVIARVAPQSPRMTRGLMQSSLIAAYDDERRHYHNVAHIAAMLANLDTHGGDARDCDALVLAILFHDAVYDPTRSDNEAASARLARLYLTDLGASDAVISRVEALILATRHGEQPAATDTDMALLVDIDLAILAAAGGDYMAYAAAIRREYAHVPDDVFRPRRAAVLDGFLSRPRIFATADLAERWEARARANLATEIAVLRSV